jgi:hypothetical protein
MTEKHEEGDLAVLVSDSDWGQICEMGHFRCQLCGDPPPIEDIAAFIDDKTCAACAAAARKVWNE